MEASAVVESSCEVGEHAADLLDDPNELRALVEFVAGLAGNDARLASDAAPEVEEEGSDYQTYKVWVGGRKDYLEDAIAHLIVKNGWGLNSIWRERHSLEDYFRHRTYKAQAEAGHA